MCTKHSHLSPTYDVLTISYKRSFNKAVLIHEKSGKIICDWRFCPDYGLVIYQQFQLYQCSDKGILKLRFGVGIKEMRENELVLQDAKPAANLKLFPTIMCSH